METRLRSASANASWVVLIEERGARPVAGHTGLYHFALRLPERIGLAHWLAHAARDRVPLTGLSDHFVSEALYRSDPDGHGIEIHWDRPREVWEGQVSERMTTLPLDVDSLLGEVEDVPSIEFDGLPTGTVMGRVHLKVARIPDTVSFYRDVIRFALMALELRRHRECRHDHDEDEEVVDRQAFLDDVAGEVLAAEVPAGDQAEGHAEGERDSDVEDRGEDGLAEADGVLVTGPRNEEVGREQHGD
jgi:hypothetical protein